MKNMKNLLLVPCLMFCLSSCQDWLTIQPETQVTKEDMFKTQGGFYDALIGCYTLMRDNYSPDASMVVGGVEYMANLWITATDGGTAYDFASHDYRADLVEMNLSQLFLKQYEIIANVNTLLEYIDIQNNVLTEDEGDLYKGEALGLRAFIHFDLIRLWGPMPTGINGNRDYLPYVTTVQLENYPYSNYQEYMAKLCADLDSAELLLQRVDLIVANDKSASYRQNRMNYYAVLGTLARVHLTLGTTDDMEKAYDYAMEVIESGKFRPIQEEHILVSGEQAKYRDILFTDEFIFGLYSAQVDAFYKSNFDESYGVKKILINKLSDIYGQGTRDLRQTHWFKTSWGTSYLLKHNADLEYAKEKVRMITLAEMYYIAAEAHPAEAYDLLEEILPSREIHSSLPVNAGRTEVLTEVLKEYRKEYIGDGQFFYAYKRLIEEEAAIHPLGINIPNENKVLVWPLPQDEIKYGDRESGIWKTEK